MSEILALDPYTLTSYDAPKTGLNSMDKDLLILKESMLSALCLLANDYPEAKKYLLTITKVIVTATTHEELHALINKQRDELLQLLAHEYTQQMNATKFASIMDSFFQLSNHLNQWQQRDAPNLPADDVDRFSAVPDDVIKDTIFKHCDSDDLQRLGQVSRLFQTQVQSYRSRNKAVYSRHPVCYSLNPSFQTLFELENISYIAFIPDSDELIVTHSNMISIFKRHNNGHLQLAQTINLGIALIRFEEITDPDGYINAVQYEEGMERRETIRVKSLIPLPKAGFAAILENDLNDLIVFWQKDSFGTYIRKNRIPQIFYNPIQTGSGPHAMAMSPTGELALGKSNQMLEIWRPNATNEYQCVQRLRNQTSLFPYRVNYLSDGTLVLASYNGRIKTFKKDDNGQYQEGIKWLANNRNILKAFAVTPGNELISSAPNGEIIFWSSNPDCRYKIAAQLKQDHETSDVCLITHFSQGLILVNENGSLLFCRKKSNELPYLQSEINRFRGQSISQIIVREETGEMFVVANNKLSCWRFPTFPKLTKQVRKAPYQEAKKLLKKFLKRHEHGNPYGRFFNLFEHYPENLRVVREILKSTNSLREICARITCMNTMDESLPELQSQLAAIIPTTVDDALVLQRLEKDFASITSLFSLG